MPALPPEVAALVGPAPEDRSGGGEGRVMAGNGKVARIGSVGVVAREAFVLGLPTLPLAVPELVASGPGWIVTAEVADSGAPWEGADLHAALADLGRLHDHFEEQLPAGAAATLRRPFETTGIGGLLAPARSTGAVLPPTLAALLADPGPLLGVLAEAAPTLLHGDPWPGNVRRPSAGRRVWIDWEHASVGPAAADLATWLDQTPWYLEAEIDEDEHLDAYLAARRRKVHRATFRRQIDAAGVLWFLAFDVPRLAGGHEMAARMVTSREAAAHRALG